MPEKSSLDNLNELASNSDILDVLKYLETLFPDKTIFSTSFGLEDQIITDIIFKNNLNIKIFTLDTGRLFNETYRTWKNTIKKYNKPSASYNPDAIELEKMLTEKGPFSFYESVENRKECCNIRKVNPLKKALNGMECWITGLRAEQSDARKNINFFLWDENNNIIKYNPLLKWTYKETCNYIEKNEVPFNALHNNGFVSIGCSPCTRAIQSGEDFRAGRWWWEDNSKKECGLHK